MTKDKALANTPYFVLRSDNQPICPTLHCDDPKAKCVCVYGFSGRSVYDQFIGSTKQQLVPYPLVQGYLANQVADAAEKKGAQSGLVILDATDGEQPKLLAATMDAVRLAQQEKAKQIEVEYELEFDTANGGYRFA